MAQIYEEVGRPEDARKSRLRGIELAESRLELHPDDSRALYMGANGLVALGEKERGLEWARRARALAPDDSMLLYNLGCIYSLAGDYEEAMSCLEKSIGVGRMTQKAWYEHDSNLDPLRGLPRFKELLDSLE
ncbi:MAG: tetratricopeptide repeat protein [Acidobacteria bacterium]|nr:tetratricopeptide repeat protein [Acidobacteriota bacterium]